MTRIYRLRKQLEWSQQQMAAYLGLTQSRVCHLENGDRESGAVKKLLDLLEAQTPGTASEPQHQPEEAA